MRNQFPINAKQDLRSISGVGGAILVQRASGLGADKMAHAEARAQAPISAGVAPDTSRSLLGSAGNSASCAPAAA